MTRAELMAKAEALIIAADRNLAESVASLQAAPPGTMLVSDSIDLINAQTGLAAACIDLARMK